MTDITIHLSDPDPDVHDADGISWRDLPDKIDTAREMLEADRRARARAELKWSRAWRRAMRDRGYPSSRMIFGSFPVEKIDPETGEAATYEVGYSWEWDTRVSRIIDTDFHRIGRVTAWYVAAARHAFDTAHEAFLEVDHLRPAHIEPSPKLAELLKTRAIEFARAEDAS